MKTYKKIMVATDFSECGNRAVNEALAVCPADGELTLCHVVVPPAPTNPMYGVHLPETVWNPSLRHKVVERSLDSLKDLVDAYDGEKNFALKYEVPVGAPVEELVNLAKAKNTDLLVVGTHGRTGLSRWVMGAVSERVVRLAECPVLVVR